MYNNAKRKKIKKNPSKKMSIQSKEVKVLQAEVEWFYNAEKSSSLIA